MRLLRRTPPLPAFDLPEPESARRLRVAVILDPFSELAFRYEWDQVTFGPDDWRRVLGEAKPDLLFVESAWNGNAVPARQRRRLRRQPVGRWRLHLTRDDQPSAQLRELVAWCRGQGIPTVFWNKEDPPNYDRFLATARLFDQVFTVDADRIPAYQRDLGHDRIDLLPFAAQPRIHNPVRRGRPGPRPYAVAFAGTWFAEKHPERRAQMEYLLAPAREYGLHIWSRMQKGDRRYRFPREYAAHVVGSLPYERMLAAYTAYRVFLNVNSVTTSKTMGSRRLFELSAAQTAVVTAPAASIEPLFGDTVEVARDAAEARASLGALLSQDHHRDRLALRAHRRVYDDHLYTHRVEAVLRSVGLADPGAPTVPGPSVSVVVPTRRPEQLEHVLTTVARQSWPRVQLVLVPHGFVPAEVRERAADLGLEDVLVRPADAHLSLGTCMNLGVEAAGGDLVAKVDDDNFYGRNYLTDLVRALDYARADVTGKWAHHVYLEATGATLLRFEAHEHRYTDLVQGGTLLMRRELASEVRFEDLPRRVDTTFLEKVRAGGGTVYSADRFNFVSVRRADPGSHTWPISDGELMSRSSRLLSCGDPRPHVEA